MPTSYSPFAFADHTHQVSPYYGSLGNRQWESIASHIIAACQSAHHWKPLPLRAIPHLRSYVPAMERAGLVRSTQRSLMLTEAALERIADHYPWVAPPLTISPS